MIGSALALTAASVGGTAMFAPASAATDQEAEIQRHLTEATRNSGGDLDLINTVRTYSCDAVEDPDFYDRTSAERKSTRVPLTQIFDNVWYIGSMYVGQFIVQTESGGYVLVDSLNNAAEVDEYTVPALEQLGVGPEHPLEGVLLSHGHGDHDGGAARLRALYGPDLDIYIGSGDIYIGSGDAGGKSYSPKTIDSAIVAPQELVIGGTTFVAQSIPGHTPGALNFLIPVKQGDQDHLMLMGGRQGHPRGAEAAAGYLEGTQRTYDLIAQYGVDGTMLTHPTSDGSTVKMQAIERSGSRDVNPFVIGTDRTLRAAAIWRGCAAAWLASVDATASTPVWRITTLEVASPRAHANSVSARIVTGWGDPGDDPDWAPPAGETVTFSVEGTDAACEAVTDDTGTATCTLPGRLQAGQRVLASFAGSATDSHVTKPSSGSAVVADAPADTQRPVVTLTSPTTAGPLRSVDIGVTATDDLGLDTIVANVYDASHKLVASTQSAVDGIETTATHTASVELADGDYSIAYNAHDLAGNVSETKRFDFSVDTTAPTVTGKKGAAFTIATGSTYDKISFKLSDAQKIDKVSLNGEVIDLTDDKWSDLNGVTASTMGGVRGANTLIVYDVAGNTSSYEFTLN